MRGRNETCFVRTRGKCELVEFVPDFKGSLDNSACWKLISHDLKISQQWLRDAFDHVTDMSTFMICPNGYAYLRFIPSISPLPDRFMNSGGNAYSTNPINPSQYFRVSLSASGFSTAVFWSTLPTVPFWTVHTSTTSMINIE